MSTDEAVKVAVRVRPFNKREIARNAKMIVEMSGASTKISNPEDSNESKTFAFDYSYWSFDGSKDRGDGYQMPDKGHSNGSKFCDQEKVFNDLGKGILKNAWEGYNSSLFAYGQTGSGKSWSVFGYGINKGIVPMFAEQLFKEIETKKAAGGIEFEVKLSMLEIYNEVASDLLVTTAPGKKKPPLKIRQDPKKGFYADGLKEVLVNNYDEINARMEEGTVNRTVASTNMNATSSRAHTIVGVRFTQKSKNAAGKEMEKKSLINIVDLAGSERVDSTGATGDRLKEGAKINLSLSSLGNVISALAKQSEGQKVRVPYRDSALTMLLQNALGGNSKTIMIAAISPADINYEESFSTLRYADRAKQIKTKAIVNEDPTEKLIRELKAENERLKARMGKGDVSEEELKDMAGKESMSKKELEEMKKQWMEEMKANMKNNEKEAAEQAKTTEQKREEQSAAGNVLSKILEEKKHKAHLFNLNFDPQLSGRLVHIFQKDNTEIGNTKGKESDICMVGPGVHQQHAIVRKEHKHHKVFIKPGEKDCRILVNGDAITSEVELQHNDRLVFGSTQVWVFQNPKEHGIGKKKYPPITFEYSQEEIAAKAGIKVDGQSGSSSDMALLQEDLIDVMPAVEEANSISEELDKRVKFEIILISPHMLGKMQGTTKAKVEGFDNMKSTQPEVCVKMKNLENGTEFIWPKEKFLNRLYLMKEMYNNYEEEEEDWDLPEDKDPFQEDVNTEVNIGSVQVFLQPVAYMVEMKEQLEITDLKGNKIGVMNLEVAPCNKKGREYTEADDKFVDSPDELVGKDVHFIFKIINCRGLPNKYTDVHCKYHVYLDTTEVTTEKISLTANPDFNHKKQFSFNPATRQLVDYLNNGSINVQIVGKQYIRKSAVASKKGMSTKEMLKSDRAAFAKTANLMNGFQMNGRQVDPQKQSIVVELLLMKKTQARLQQRCDNMKKMLEKADQLHRSGVSCSTIKSFFNAHTDEQLHNAMKQLEAFQAAKK